MLAQFGEHGHAETGQVGQRGTVMAAATRHDEGVLVREDFALCVDQHQLGVGRELLAGHAGTEGAQLNVQTDDGAAGVAGLA